MDGIVPGLGSVSGHSFPIVRTHVTVAFFWGMLLLLVLLDLTLEVGS
jgi:hypothetical protein